MKRYATLASLALLLVSGAAHADPQSQQEAKDLFHGGAQAYAVGQFDKAVQYLDAAYALSPQPAILFSLSQALRRAYAKDQKPETLARALQGFRQYLKEVPQGPRVKDAAAAVTELELLQQKVGAPSGDPTTTPSDGSAKDAELIVTSGTKGATIDVDGHAQLGDDGAPLPEYWSGTLEAGTHTIRVRAEGYFEVVRTMRLTAGRPHALDIVLSPRPARLFVRAPAGTRVQVDGRFAGETPLAAALEVTAGTHVVSLLKNGYVAQSKELTLTRGATATLDRQLSTSTQRKVSYVFGGAGAASWIASVAFFGAALTREQAASDLDTKRRSTGLTLAEKDDYDNALADRNRYRSAGLIWFGVGTGLLAIGGVLYLFDQPSGGSEKLRVSLRPERTQTPRVTLRPSLGLGGVGLSGTF